MINTCDAQGIGTPTIVCQIDDAKVNGENSCSIIDDQTAANADGSRCLVHLQTDVLVVNQTAVGAGGLSRQQEIAVDVSAVNLAPTALSLSNNQIFQGMPTNSRGMLVRLLLLT